MKAPSRFSSLREALADWEEPGVVLYYLGCCLGLVGPEEGMAAIDKDDSVKDDGGWKGETRDIPESMEVAGSTDWPKGLGALVNATNRVWGYVANGEEVFFFYGGQPEFTAFLQGFSRLEGIDNRRLILHNGVGEAKSPWEKTGRPCDWKLYICPKGLYNLKQLSKRGTSTIEALHRAAKETGYIVEVHLWTGGCTALDRKTIPTNVAVQRVTTRANRDDTRQDKSRRRIL